MMKRGTDHTLDEDDLWDLPTSDQAEGLTQKLGHYWKLQLQKSRCGRAYGMLNYCQLTLILKQSQSYLGGPPRLWWPVLPSYPLQAHSRHIGFCSATAPSPPFGLCRHILFGPSRRAVPWKCNRRGHARRRDDADSFPTSVLPESLRNWHALPRRSYRPHVSRNSMFVKHTLTSRQLREIPAA